MRKCGTCRHFSDCGVAGSGNCLHDHRRHLLDVVLVRRTELACRNTYDQDLWEPLPNRADADAPMMGGLYRPLPEPDPPGIIAGSEEVRPAPGLGLPGRLHLRAARGAEDEQPQPTDLESQATGVISEHPGGAGAREARKRRQAMLDQEKRQAFQARTGVNLPEPTRRSGRANPTSPTSPTIDVQPTIDDGGTNAPSQAASDAAPSWKVTAPEVSVEFSGRRPTPPTALPQPPAAPPVHTSMGAASATTPTRVEDAPRRVEQGPRPRINRQPPQQAAAQQREAPRGAKAPEPRKRQAQQAPRAAQAPQEQQTHPRVQPTEQFDVVPPATRQSATPRAAAPAPSRLAPLPVPRSAVNGGGAAQPPDAPRADTEAGRSTPSRPSHSARRNEREVQDPATYGAPQASTPRYTPENDELLALPPRRQASSDLASARPQDPIDVTVRYAGVPRCCATCVSYQRGEGNARGHCHNVHVFTVPHPVDADGLACRSSMGSWWLPANSALAPQTGQGHGHGRGQIRLQEQHGPRKQERGRDV